MDDCPKCGGKGYIKILCDDYVYQYERIAECDCSITAKRIQQSMARIKRSGLAELLDEYTFDKFEVSEPWQREAKDKAKRYVKDFEGHWFFVGGQVGAGKTHLCTAIVREMMLNGQPARYMEWRDTMTKLRALRFNERMYGMEMDKWCDEPVIYIDDLFKSTKLDAAEVDITFQIINHRYNNPSLATIISSEKTIAEISGIDEGIGSRIFQRAKDYGVRIPRDAKMNKRYT